MTRRQPRNGCNGKVKHTSKANAIIAAKRVKNVQMNIYKCSSCKMWHLGRSRNPDRIQDRIDQLLGKYKTTDDT